MPEPRRTDLPKLPEPRESELQLEPIAVSPQVPPSVSINESGKVRSAGHFSANASGYRKNPHVLLYATDGLAQRDGAPQVKAENHEAQVEEIGHSLPTTRYETIGSLRRYLGFAGYLTLAAGPLFLVVRFIQLSFFAGDNPDPWIAAFSVYALWVTVMSAFTAAFLLAGSELLQLVLDVAGDMQRVVAQTDLLPTPNDDFEIQR